jgi:hypothetical protein
MIRKALALLPAFALLLGCGQSKPTPVATDPESIKRLEEEQKKAARGEK